MESDQFLQAFESKYFVRRFVLVEILKEFCSEQSVKWFNFVSSRTNSDLQIPESKIHNFGKTSEMLQIFDKREKISQGFRSGISALKILLLYNFSRSSCKGT